MIVRDEAPVILRCLDSVLPHVQGAVVVDTGSTDSTQQLVRDRLRDEEHRRPELRSYPVIERPWFNFEHNRNEALALARSLAGPDGWILTIDADEVLVDGGSLHGLDVSELDGVYLQLRYGETRYDRMALVRANEPWAWRGVVHEVLVHPGQPRTYRVSGPHVLVRKEGSRSRDPRAFEKDAALLATADQADPRVVYYLAQSLHCAGRLPQALQTYYRRAAMRGWAEETWSALHRAANIVEQLGRPELTVTGAYLKAHEFRPSRPEPLADLARYLNSKNKFVLALLFAEAALRIPPHADTLFVQDVRWKLLDAASIACHYLGYRTRAQVYYLQLTAEGRFPASERDRIAKNGEFLSPKAE